MFDPISWMVGKALEWQFAKALDRMFARDLLDHLRQAVREWAEQLPGEAYAHPSAMWPPLAPHRLGSAIGDRPELTHVRSVLLEGYPPVADLWAAVLREHWEITRKRAGGDPQPFFSRTAAEVEPHLQRLAGALHRVCTEDPKLFQREMLRRTDALAAPPASTEPTVLVSPAEFFRPFMGRNRLFNHAWSLVGRKQVLENLHSFTHSSQHQVAVLPGRGGIGKSKLLQEMARQLEEAHPPLPVRFVAPGMPITPAVVDELPDGPSVVVVDDAHRHEGLDLLLTLLHRHNSATKIILSARPSGVDRVLLATSRAGFDVREIVRLDELRDLSREEIKELAHQALGNRQEHWASALVAATRDSPLLTVVGGRLLAEGQVHPALMQQHEDFRRVVLDAFEDVLLGTVSERLPQDICRALLRVLAAVAPVDPGTESFRAHAVALLGIGEPALMEAVGVLEEAGVLLRRGRTVRITPDVLADHILEEACITRGGTPTGYSKQVYAAFDSGQRAHVFRNLAELDWRLRHSDLERVDLLGDIWSDVHAEFRAAPGSGRSEMMRTLVDVAFYQPARCLDLVEFAMRSPPTTPEPEVLAAFFLPLRSSQESVLAEIPPVLQRIAYNRDFTSRACDLLWVLGRDDARETNPHPEHAIRVLADLAAYEIEKPVDFNEEVFQAVQRWMESPDAHDYRHSPLDVVDPLLTKVAMSTEPEGSTFTLGAFQVSPAVTRRLRDRVLEVVSQTAHAERLDVSVRAIRTLDEAIRPPMPVLGLEFTEVDYEAWLPEQLKAMSILAGLCAQPRDPVVHLMCVRAVDWHAQYGPAGRLRDRAREIVASVPRSFDLAFTEALLAQPVEALYPDGSDESDRAALASWERYRERRRVAATEFMARYPGAREGFDVFARRWEAIRASGVEGSPSEVLSYLAQSSPSYAAAWCDIAVEEVETPLSPYLGALLGPLREQDPDRFSTIARRILQGGDTPLCGSLAAALRGAEWEGEPNPDHVRVLQDLLAHDDEWVRRSALPALRDLGRARTRLAIDLGVGASIGTSSALADTLCSMFDPDWGLNPGLLTDADWDALLSKLEDADEIGGYDTMRFLSNASIHVPRRLLRLFLTRVERGGEQPPAFRPLPFEFRQSLQGLTQSAEYDDMLRDVRDRILDDVALGDFWLPRLYRTISNGYDEGGLKVLAEWIQSGNAEKIEGVGSLLSAAGQGFVFEHAGFVSELLGRAEAVGEDTYQAVFADLFGIAVSGTHSRTVGEPSARDVRMRDKGRELSERPDLTSAARRFYSHMSERAERAIRDALARDEEEM